MGSACSGPAVASSVDEPKAPDDQPQQARPTKKDSQNHQESADIPKQTEINEQPVVTNGDAKEDEQAFVYTGDEQNVQNAEIIGNDEDVDQEIAAIDGGPAQYKLVYFAGLRFRAETTRLILRYADVPYDEQLVSFEEWPQIKESTPMRVLPLLYVNENVVICQSNAIGRYLAKKYGLAGRNNVESALVDMFVDALTDIMNEVAPLLLERDLGKRSDMWHQLKDDVIIPFLDRCIKFLADNDSGWFVGSDVTWADLAISEYLANLNEKIDTTLLDPYPALRAHINGVRTLPRISEYIAERPDALI